MMARAMPVIARVMVCFPLAIPLASPAEVRILKPPPKIIIKETRPIRGIMASRMLPKYSGICDSWAASVDAIWVDYIPIRSDLVSRLYFAVD